MNYCSTRDKAVIKDSAQAILQGISADGGLFVPTEIPKISPSELQELCGKSYVERARVVLGKFLTDFTPDEIKDCVEQAYSLERFDDAAIAPIARISPDSYLLELWHGPTCAFKDMALQLLPRLMVTSANKTGEKREIVILVATSGDTGKAALEGFCDVPGTRMMVFYPEEGVSPMQKRQMCTQDGDNVWVCGIRGNFDDAQSGVKTIFADKATADEFSAKGKMLSSANSINWGRLVPQVVYYISAYCDMVASGEITMGQEINVTVPTGNFGNILAAYYAREMGLPIGKLICASNRNNVLTDFLGTGVYDRNRQFYATSSPSMDILISSNLERLLWQLSKDDALVKELMAKLSTNGRYEVSGELFDKIKELFDSGYCDDDSASATISRVFDDCSYLADTHTAVAIKVAEDYVARTGDKRKMLIVSTASPYKFSHSVLGAIAPKMAAEILDEFEQAKAMEGHTSVAMPSPLKELEGKAVRFTQVCDKDKMLSAVQQAL